MTTDIQTGFDSLRTVQQRVAQQSLFDWCVSNVETKVNAELNRLRDQLHEQQEQSRSLAALVFKPDVKLISHDGVSVPALKSVLTNSSPVFQGMFAEHTAETRDGEVKTDATAAVLIHIVKALHCPNLAQNPAEQDGEDAELLLSACELASRWELAAVFRATASALRRKMRAEGAVVILATADRHLEADPHSACWKELREEAAVALASSVRHGAKHPDFQTLSLNAILEVMSHVTKTKVTLPELTVDTASAAFTGRKWIKGEPNADLDWCPALDDQGKPSVGFPKYTIQVRKDQEGGVGVYVVRLDSHRRQVDIELQINDKTLRRKDKAFFKYGWSRFLSAAQIPTFAADGKVTVKGSVTITARQRQADVLNMWLLATGRVQAPLGPADLLLCLRACACGFDIAGADTDALKERLTERGLETTGGTKRELQTRLRDAMYTALPMAAASGGGRQNVFGSACHALAELTAASCGKCVIDGSLFELDAAAFSMVLAQDEIDVESESALLEHAVRWASRVGRTEEMVSRVMPLVRFPLVSLLRPSAALKSLQQRNGVVAQLIKEALALQVQPASAVATFTPTKHRLLEGVVPGDTDDVPRTKRRKLCVDDKVVAVDPAEALFAASF